ncbi:MAG: acyl carrier protein [Bacteroidetes bacterium]|nr:MAG: acyl carrier protein [Bacteroidota bacterium]
MSIDEFIQKIENEIEELPKGVLKPDTSYRQLPEWSSMHALIIIALCETDYNVTLTGEDLRSCNTVNDLYSVVKSRI